MKACIIQPHYSVDYSESDKCFDEQLELLDKCDDSMDLIVMPEACDIPALAKTLEQRQESIAKYNKRLLNKVSETAKRCNAMVFVNARYNNGVGDRNTTYAFDRNGNIAGLYFKRHLTPKEGVMPERDSEYSFLYSEPTVIEMEGLRFGFLTCYDFYFYEYFAVMARQNLDIIIGCSHQRSDTHDALETMSKFIAYNTNTHVIRASVSMDENSNIGGGSVIVSPTGKILANLKSKIGLACVEFDPKDKYYKPAGFGNPDAAHYQYVEAGRRPWKYRPGGSAIVQNDVVMNYPRVCAHRGFCTGTPENSMPAFGTAIAMGADEIEFDLRVTKDGEIVSIHDAILDRISNGTGKVEDHTYEELCQLDFGVKYGERFSGMKVLRFEEILKKFSCHAVMNIHIKTETPDSDYDPENIKKIIEFVRRYDCEKYVYLMSGNDNVLAIAREIAPHIPRCVGAGNAPDQLVERALKYNCKKIQLAKNKMTAESVKQTIEKAHANGIVCNMYWSDDADEAESFLDMGIDTILTNELFKISEVVGKRTKYKK